MKRWVRWAAWLYPAEWRARYGAEFDVFLDDAPLRWRDLADVIRGAAIMQMTSWMTYWKMAPLAGVAGAMIAGAIALTIPNRYVSTAVLRLENRSGATPTPLVDVLQKTFLGTVGRVGFELLHDPHLDLFPKERRRFPAEQVAEDTFRRHLRIVPYEAGSNPDIQSFRIVFDYPDPYKAKVVVERVTDSFMREILQQQMQTPNQVTLRLLEPARLPERPASPARFSIALMGAFAGSLLGLLALVVWRRTRNYSVVTMSLPKDTKRFVDSRIAAGQYRSVGEYLGELIRADEQRSK